MAALSSPVVRRALRLTGYLLLTLVVYWFNAVTPPSARLGILYIIPVLLVTWTEGLAWGLVFAVATTGLRQADVVGRLGGDEFAVLRPETDAQVADAAAKRLIVSLRNVFKGTPNVTASIGVVSCTATDASTDDLLRRADQAMYDAKKSGKDR